MAERSDNAIMTSDATTNSNFKSSVLKLKTEQIKTVLLPNFFAFFKANAKSLIFLLFAVVFAIMSAVVVFWSFQQIEAIAVARQRSQLVIHHANLLTSNIKDAETSMRGYLLTNNLAFLQPYSAVISPIKLQLKQLQQLSLTKLEHQRLNALLPLIEAKLTHMARAVALQRNNNQTEALALIKRAEGLQLMNAIRLEMQQFITAQEAALAQNEASFQANMQRFFYIITLFVFLFTLFSVFLALY